MAIRGSGSTRAAALLEEASSALILTGAGISAESGVPTFRGEGGLWRSFRAEDLATPEAFERDPRLVWEWYGSRRDAVAACIPNEAHLALARWQRGSAGARIVTQNVDGLHSLATRLVAGGGPAEPEGLVDPDGPAEPGEPERREEPARPAEPWEPGERNRREEPDGPAAPGRERTLEIHGTLFRIRCTGCDLRVEHRGKIDSTSAATLPLCPACGELARPDVVWFGEALERRVIDLAFRWAEAADVCLVVGTSAVVQPAASLATVTRDTGGAIIEVNPDATPLTPLAEVSIRGGAAEVIPTILPD